MNQANSSEWQGNITLSDIDEQGRLLNRSMIITRKPSQSGRTRIEIGERYSRGI